jgi:hypothetical protein
MLQLRLMEKKRELVRRANVDALIDEIAGVTLTALSSLFARCGPRGDLRSGAPSSGSCSRCAPRWLKGGQQMAAAKPVIHRSVSRTDDRDARYGADARCAFTTRV